MTDLKETLTRATDHLDATDMAGPAWQEAGRRRVRRRAAAGVLASAAVVALVAVPLALGGGNPDTAPAEDPSRTPRVIPEGTQPVWDPFSVEEAPRRESILPVELSPPDGPPAITADPMPAAVVAWPTEGEDLRLLGVDGRWRSVPDTADAPGAYASPMVGAPVLSGDGTRLAMSTEQGALVVDVATGKRLTLPWPDQLAGPWDIAPALRWMPGDDQLLVLHWRHTWLMELDGGAREAAYSVMHAGPVAVDPDGPVRVWSGARKQLRTYEDGTRTALIDVAIWGDRWVAGFGLAAATGAPTPASAYGFAGPVVVDPATGEVVAYAPIRDRSSVYSDNGHLTAQGFLDADTVLLLVAPMNFRTMDAGEERAHLVAWRFRTGEFELISTGDRALRSVALAPGLMPRP